MTSSPGRILPQDFDAERALLGALLLGAFADTPLVPADFMRGSHGRVFGAIATLRAAGEPVDAVTVAAMLESAGTLEAVGGKYELQELAGAAPISSHAEHYARIVGDKARRRAVIRVAADVTADAYNSPDSAAEIEGRAVTGMLGLQDAMRRESDSASEAVARRLEEYANPMPSVMLPGADTRLHFGDVCVLGGRPGTGKTAMALQAADVWRKCHKVLVLSFEMSIGELADRLIARATGTTSEVAYAGLTEGDRDIYTRYCANLLADDSLLLKQAAGMSEAQTVASIRAFAAAGGQIVVLDYLQIAAESRTNENADITRLMRVLQQVAKQTGVCLLVLSQYSRSATDGKPGLHHLRGSGSIEQEAATVGLLWTPEPEDQTSRKAELAKQGYALDPDDPRQLTRLQWSKVRHGAQATDYFLFDGEGMNFEPVVSERR